MGKILDRMMDEKIVVSSNWLGKSIVLIFLAQTLIILLLVILGIVDEPLYEVIFVSIIFLFLTHAVFSLNLIFTKDGIELFFGYYLPGGNRIRLGRVKMYTWNEALICLYPNAIFGFAIGLFMISKGPLIHQYLHKNFDKALQMTLKYGKLNEIGRNEIIKHLSE